MAKTASANRHHVIAPKDHWEAFKAAASKAGLSVSEWLCLAGVEKLPKKVASQLSERQGVGRPVEKVSENSEKSCG
jgi:hypothetical protein